jgi:diadenosine tetraphosphate (Ap4A) HIT family hydrolase
MFELDPRLRADCLPLGRFPLSQLLLMNDANYRWLILVPERADVSELYQLSEQDQQQLMRESCYLARQLAHGFRADKMNVAALGNVVSQLHVHHIVRYRGDPAWPAPVWGKVPARPYTEEGLVEVRAVLAAVLPREFTPFEHPPGG